MKPLLRVPFPQWLPDRPPYGNQGANEARNVIAQADSYREFRGLEAASAILDASNPCVGVFWARDDGQTVNVLAGTADALYQLQGDKSWTDVSKSGGYSGVSNWEFVRFGTSVIAVAAGITPQVIDLADSSPQFADLSGGPPTGERVAIVRDCVVIGNLGSGDEDTIQWSGGNNETIWNDPIQEADAQRLYEGGAVQKVTSGPFGLVFQEDVIRRMDYVGPPLTFSIQPISRDRGTLAPNSVVETGNEVYWYAQDGFFKTDGRQVLPIGEERVNRWFADNADPDSLTNMRGAADRVNRIIVWAFKSSGSAARNDRLLIYNYSVDKWSYAVVETEVVAESRNIGFSLDGLDTPLPNGIDIDSINLDTDAFRGGSLFLLAFDSSNQAAGFSGTPLEAIVETAEIDGKQASRMYINGIRPLLEGDVNTDVNVTLSSRSLFTDPPVISGPTGLNRLGEATLRSDARLHRIRCNVTGGFKHLFGVDVFGRQSGRQ